MSYHVYLQQPSQPSLEILRGFEAPGRHVADQAEMPIGTRYPMQEPLDVGVGTFARDTGVHIGDMVATAEGVAAPHTLRQEEAAPALGDVTVNAVAVAGPVERAAQGRHAAPEEVSVAGDIRALRASLRVVRADETGALPTVGQDDVAALDKYARLRGGDNAGQSVASITHRREAARRAREQGSVHDEDLEARRQRFGAFGAAITARQRTS